MREIITQEDISSAPRSHGRDRRGLVGCILLYKIVGAAAAMEAFVQNCKTPTKGVCAFDSLDLSTAENNVFGDASNTPEHFDSYLAGLLSENQSKYASLSGWDASYVTDYANIASVTDELSTSTEVRGNMYDPIYFAAKTCAGSGTSTIAPYWRIRTGIFQGDTSLTTETNLALALQSCSSVKDVDFATVWGQYHTMKRTFASEEWETLLPKRTWAAARKEAESYVNLDMGLASKNWV